MECALELELKKLAMLVAAFLFAWNDAVTSPLPSEGGTVVRVFLEAAVAKREQDGVRYCVAQYFYSDMNLEINK